MNKLKADFGVSALLATLIIIGSFTVIIIALITGKVDIDIILPMLGAWVGAVVASYFAVKINKESNHRR